jgi:hypothetical protein
MDEKQDCLARIRDRSVAPLIIPDEHEIEDRYAFVAATTGLQLVLIKPGAV